MLAFYIKGLLRDRSRSLLPIIVVAIGVMLVVVAHCWVTGVLGDIVTFNAKFSTGHVKIMSKAYAENSNQFPNDLALIGTDSLMKELHTEYPDMEWVQRIEFGALVDAPDKNGETKEQGPGVGMAIDLLSDKSHEVERLNLKESMVRGGLPTKPFDLILSEQFAEKLGVGIGDPVTLIGSTMYGAMSITNFTVCGTIRFGSNMLDRGGMIADISGIRSALDMQDATGEILGYFPTDQYNDIEASNLAMNFNEKYKNDTDKFAPVMVTLKEQNNLSGLLSIIGYFKSIIITVFVIAMSIVLWNSGLLGSLRRYGELGLRIAVGEEKRHIYWGMITESVIIGIIGSVAGTAIGLILSYLLTKGLDISGMMSNSTMMMQGVMRATITPEAYYIGFIPGLIATVLGTALAGIGIFKRQTAQLFKELQV